MLNPYDNNNNMFLLFVNITILIHLLGEFGRVFQRVPDRSMTLCRVSLGMPVLAHLASGATGASSVNGGVRQPGRASWMPLLERTAAGRPFVTAPRHRRTCRRRRKTSPRAMPGETPECIKPPSGPVTLTPVESEGCPRPARTRSSNCAETNRSAGS
jgi:hypothetical protein